MQFFGKFITDTPRYVQWTIPGLLYQTRWKNPLVYKIFAADDLNFSIFYAALRKHIRLNISCEADFLGVEAISVITGTWF